MRQTFLLINYGWWHYTSALEDLVLNYINIFRFIANFFSLQHLTKNLFAPWRRLGEEYPSIVNFEGFFSALIVNTMMRLVGFCIRAVLIVAGLAIVCSSFFIFLLILCLWLALPFVAAFLIILGWRLIIA